MREQNKFIIDTIGREIIDKVLPNLDAEYISAHKELTWATLK